jgi:hypothetical protein
VHFFIVIIPLFLPIFTSLFNRREKQALEDDKLVKLREEKRCHTLTALCCIGSLRFIEFSSVGCSPTSIHENSGQLCEN